MTLSSHEEQFLRAAVAAAPRIAEIIAQYPVEHRTGALEVVKRHYAQAAQRFGCTEVAARIWVPLVMRGVQKRVEQQRAVKSNLENLLTKVTQACPGLVTWRRWSDGNDRGLPLIAPAE